MKVININMNKLIATIIASLVSASVWSQSYEQVEKNLIELYAAEARKILFEDQSGLTDKNIVLVSAVLKAQEYSGGSTISRVLTFVDVSTESVQKTELPELNEASSVRDRLKTLRAMAEARRAEKDFDGMYTEYLYKSYMVFLGAPDELRPVQESTFTRHQRVKL